MYKVFVNDKPLFLTNQISKETDFELFLLDSIDVERIIVKIFQNKIQKAYLYHPDEREIMKTLKAKIPVCKAGGGLVYNKEETGVNKLQIVKKLQKTYHVFKRNGKYKLKVTHWFEMQSKFEGTPQGQLEEGIEKVAWLNPEEIKEALNNSYENIKLLFEEEKLLK